MEQALTTMLAISEAELAEGRADLALIATEIKLRHLPLDASETRDFLASFAGERPQYAHLAVLDASDREVLRIRRQAPDRAIGSAISSRPGTEAVHPPAWSQAEHMAVFYLGADEIRPAAAPVEPMIRFAVPLGGGGNQQGELLLDYPVSQLLKRFAESIAAVGTPILAINGVYCFPADKAPEAAVIDLAGPALAGSAMPPFAVRDEVDRGDQGFIQTHAGDYAFLAVGHSRYRSLRSREPFLLPSQMIADPDADIWRLAIFSKATGGISSEMTWLLALAAVLLTLAAIYFAVLNREAKRRASITAALTASERKLREQLSFNESLLHGLPVPVFVKDAAGRYVACNDAFAGVLGVPRSSIVGRSAADILPPHLAALHCEMDGAALSQWREQQYEAQSHLGGSLSHWLLFKSPFSVGDTTGVIGVALDISDRRRAEEGLKRSQQFFKRTLNTIPQPVFVKNFQHRFVFVNDAACLYLGFSREQMLGRTDHDLFPLQQAEKLAALDDLVFSSGESNLEEARITDAFGAEHVVLITRAVFDDDAGRPVLVGVITDITERKRTEELLRIGAEVFEHSSEGIMITDDRARILMVNDAFVRITGFTEAQVIGRDARIIGWEQLDGVFFRSVYRSLRRHGFWKGEVINRRRNGERYVVEMPICAVRDDAGNVLRYIAMLTDITQRKHSEARVSYLAEHDFLTGLANRALLHDRAERAVLQAQRSGKKVAALLLDLDDFKLINDSWGHAAGDLLLQHIGQRLNAVVRETDTVARVGGDEFVVLLPDLHERGDAGRVALAISTAFSKPFVSDGLYIHISVSCGIAIYPDDEKSVEGLFRAADEAMYRAKQRFRSDGELSAAGVRMASAAPCRSPSRANGDPEQSDQKSMQRPLRSQSPNRVGSGPLGPPISSGGEAAEGQEAAVQGEVIPSWVTSRPSAAAR
jgi:diguanylate cyclase (GGDEF)-like protein/PAS domain S-box-containing protein